MNKKKILFVIDSLECGGAEKSLMTLLKFIDYDQFDIDLRLHSRGGVFENLVPEKVNIQTVALNYGFLNLKFFAARVRFKIDRWFNGSKTLHNAQLYWKSFNTIHNRIDQQYDIAIAYGQGFSTYFVADKVKAAVKYTWLNTDYDKAGYNLAFDTPFYSCYKKIVVVSAENEAVFKKTFSSTNTYFETVVLRDIVDEIEVHTKAHDPIELLKETSVVTIVSVGRLIPLKGFSLAIQACKILLDSGKKVIWYVVGEGEERKVLESLIAQHGLENNFILLGMKSNPYPYIAHADIYVQPSIYEGLCITLIEARLLQKAIVTTNFPSAYGIIKNEETGIICEMNAASIAQSICRYIDNQLFKQRIIENLASQKNMEKEESLIMFNELIRL